jgi:LacI family transcriptional regulator
VSGKYSEVDGVIALGVFSDEEMAFLRSLTHAIVVINSAQRNYEYDQIQVDYERGLEQMVEYLLDIKGYKTVGYIGGLYEQGNIKIGMQRCERLKRILERRGKYDPSAFHVGEISRESGYTLAIQAARQGELAEAMLLGSDEVAEGAMEAFRELELGIPKNIAVIIYQDIQTLESKWQTGTRLEMLPDYVWQNSLGLLLDRIGQKRTQAVTLMVPAHLKVGDTA